MNGSKILCLTSRTCPYRKGTCSFPPSRWLELRRNVENLSSHFIPWIGPLRMVKQKANGARVLAGHRATTLVLGCLCLALCMRENELPSLFTTGKLNFVCFFLMLSMPFFLNHSKCIYVSEVSLFVFFAFLFHHFIVAINPHSCFFVCLMIFDQGFMFLGMLSVGFCLRSGLKVCSSRRMCDCFCQGPANTIHLGSCETTFSSQSVSHPRGSLIGEIWKRNHQDFYK